VADGERDLLNLADSVAAGDAVDWAAAEASATGEERDLLRQLRVIDEVARVNRSQTAEPRSSATAAPGGPDASGSHWGRLEILERVGGGTSGDVFRARDTALDREVALKLLKRRRPRLDEIAAQVLAEGRLLARVRHPNVITVYGAEAIDGRVGLWMEFIRGLTLDDVVARQGPFGAREATFVGIDVCRALAAVHRAGLVHRDVKGANIMREAGGRLVLMDFGTGHDLAEPGPDGRMAGTPLYLAPEMFAGRAATPQSDLYSVGVLLYHLVTGAYPVDGRTLMDLAQAHRAGRVTRLRDARPDLPGGFILVVERALAADPGQRFESAGAMETALAGWLGLAATTPDPSPAPAAPAPATRARPVLAWMVAAVLAIVVAAATAALWVRRSAPQAADASAGRIRSIAVLPLQNLAGEEYFADGMTDALIADLGKMGGVDVISRTSVMRFKGTRQPLPDIGRALNVDAILEGSVLRAGSRVRITVDLVEARTDRRLWTETYERDVKDVIAMQNDVARAVARAINVTLSRQDEERLAASGHAVAPEAYEAYLKGRYYWNRRDPDSLRQSVTYFERALAADAQYAPAYAGLADAYTVLGSVGGALPPGEAMAKARQATESALALDDSLGEAHTSLAMVQFWHDWQWADAEASFRRAIKLNPSYPTAHHWFAIYLSAMGRHDEAMAEMDQASRLDPVSPIIQASRGWVLYQRRQFDRSLEECRRTLALEPTFLRAYNYIGMNYLQKRMPAEALRALQEADRLAGPSAVARGELAQAYVASGRRDEATAILDALLKPGAYPYVASADIATIYIALGDRDRAFAWLEKAYQERSFAMVYLKVHPAYDPIRADPRFVDLLARLRFP